MNDVWAEQVDELHLGKRSGTVIASASAESNEVDFVN